MMDYPYKVLIIVALVLTAFSAQTFGAAYAENENDKSARSGSVYMLDPALEWSGKNRERLNAFMAANAWKVGDNRPQPVAVFDWDNTIIKNDIGDYFFVYMLRHNLILKAPEGDWRRSSRYLSEAAQARLAEVTRNYQPGKPLPTSTDTSCAAEFMSIYTRAKTTAGAEAFAVYNHQTLEPSYAWTTQLTAGYSPQQIRTFAVEAIEEALAAPQGSKAVMAGNDEIAGWVRIYPQMLDLITQLRKHGFDVWIVSASNQYIIEAFSDRVGVCPDHVIGVRSLTDKRGLLTYDLQGCGPVMDGENSLITYKLGKRCWINSRIFVISADQAFDRNPDQHKRPTFAAGDSDTDMPFVADASGMHLVINRNKSEIMCNALKNTDGNWLVNPMFIDPLPERKQPYPCSSTACVMPDGAPAPCRMDDGTIIEDLCE